MASRAYTSIALTPNDVTRSLPRCILGLNGENQMYTMADVIVSLTASDVDGAVLPSPLLKIIQSIA